MKIFYNKIRRKSKANYKAWLALRKAHEIFQFVSGNTGEIAEQQFGKAKRKLKEAEEKYQILLEKDKGE